MGANQVDQALRAGPVEVGPALLDLPEDQWFERKSIRSAPKDVAVALVALANAEGGTLVVGLHAGRVEGTRSRTSKVNALRQASLDHTRPPVRVQIAEVACVNADGADDALLVLHVDPGEGVHELTRGDCYLRVGDESRKLSFHQRQELHFDRGAAPYDGQPAPGATMAELDTKHVDAYCQSAGATRDQHHVLRARSLLVDDRPTVAAYLLFGSLPQERLPHAIVRILRFTADERGTGSRQSLDHGSDTRVEGAIPDVIHRSAELIEAAMPKRRVLAESGRFEPEPIVPRDAWLEGLVNAVIHRSYSAAGDHIRVSIHPRRVEIDSPGRFPGLIDPQRPLDINRYARNPRIARVCSDLGIGQELGEGIARIFDEMRQRGLADPAYQQTASTVRLTLQAVSRLDPAIRRQLPRGGESLLTLLRQSGRPLGTGDLVEVSGLSRPTVTKSLRLLLRAGLVEWQGKSPKDPRATWRAP